MNIVDNSLTIVLLGDWSKLYTQPEWIANNVFCKPEMDIGVEAQGIEFNVTYKCDDILINPSREKVIISATNIEKETLEFLATCANNYISKAKTPLLIAYGLNIDFIETENTFLSEMFDSVSDARTLVNLNYEILKSQINRTIVKNDKVINITYTQEQTQSKISFNEHYENPKAEEIYFKYENISDFINRCKEIANGLGYEFEEDEDE